MEKAALFQKNANVADAGGKQIGSLERVVLHPETKVITDIVIQSGGLFNKEHRVVPVHLIAQTTETEIVLHNEVEDLETFPLFEQEQVLTSEERPFSPPTDVPEVIYGVSGMGPAVVPRPEDQFVSKVEQNIPEGTVALKEGAKVLTIDEKHIGNVNRVLTDPATARATHLIISQGLLSTEKKVIPMELVQILDEKAVHLGVTEAAIQALNTGPSTE
jgi:uncharacterized protein YrrD